VDTYRGSVYLDGEIGAKIFEPRYVMFYRGNSLLLLGEKELQS